MKIATILLVLCLTLVDKGLECTVYDNNCLFYIYIERKGVIVRNWIVLNSVRVNPECVHCNDSCSTRFIKHIQISETVRISIKRDKNNGKAAYGKQFRLGNKTKALSSIIANNTWVCAMANSAVNVNEYTVWPRSRRHRCLTPSLVNRKSVCHCEPGGCKPIETRIWFTIFYWFL